MPQQLPIPDEHPCLARDAYGFSKAMMEELTRYFHRANPDTDFINLRFGSVVDDVTWQPPHITAATPTPIPFANLGCVLLSDILQAVTMALEAPPRSLSVLLQNLSFEGQK